MVQYFPVVSGSLVVSGSIIATGAITVSGSIASSSFAATSTSASFAATAATAVTAQTSSFANTLTVAGNLTAQTLVVQTITSSVDFVTGSTRFGSLLANTHVFSGSVTMNPGGLFVSSSGLVGIGTTSPLGSSTEKTLHLSDGGAGYTTLYVTNGANTLRGIFAVANDVSTISIGTQTNHNLRIVTNDTVKMFVSSSGNVGIGTTNPKSYSILTANGQIIGINNIGIDVGQSFRLNNYYNSGTVTDRTISTGFAASIGLDNSVGGLTFNTSATSIAADNNTTVTERMRISSTGVVTTPFQPAFRAGRSSSYTPGANTVIVFNSTSGFGFNVGGHYSTSTGRFTAPVNGIYNFTACVIWESVGGGQAMDDAFEIKVNGSTAAYSFRRAAYVANTTGIGGYYVDHATALLNLTAGQYVEIQNRYNLTVHGNQNYCYFQGYLVG